MPGLRKGRKQTAKEVTTMTEMNKIRKLELKDLKNVSGGRREKIQLPENLSEEDKKILERLTNIKL